MWNRIGRLLLKGAKWAIANPELLRAIVEDMTRRKKKAD